MPGVLRLGASTGLLVGKTRFRNPKGETGAFLVGDETLDRLRREHLQVQADLYLLPFHLLLRGERKDERFRPENLNPRKPPSFERLRRAENLEGEGRMSLFGDRLFLVGVYGEEWIEDNYFGPPPMPWLPELPRDRHLTHGVFRRAGLRLQVLERTGERGTLDLALFANAGNSYRAPTLLELFGQDVSIQGNPELLPESGDQRDLGLSLSWRRGAWDGETGISVWARRLEDQILMMRNSQFSVRAENLAASELSGIEWQGEIRRRGLWALLSVSWLEAFDRSGVDIYEGKRLPYRTPRRLFVRLGLERGDWELFGDLERRAAVFSDRYNDPDAKLPPASVWGAGLRWRAPYELTLSLEMLNLGDARVEDILGYPLPGRTWMLGLEAPWDLFLGTGEQGGDA